MIEFDIQFDPASSYISDNITMDVTITGSTNDLTVDIANNSSAANLDYDAVISGDYNTWTTSIDSDNVTFNVDLANAAPPETSQAEANSWKTKHRNL